MLLNKISELCVSHGISLWKLEKLLKFGNGTFAKCATMRPGIDKVQKVADYFNVSVDYLLDRNSEIKLSADSKIIAIAFDSMPPEKQKLIKQYVDMLKAG